MESRYELSCRPVLIVLISSLIWAGLSHASEFIMDGHGFTYAESNGCLIVESYFGDNEVARIPAIYDGNNNYYLGWPVGGISAYFHSKAKRLLIPKSLTNIPPTAFDNAEELESIDVAPENPSYSSNQGVLLSKNGDAIVKYPKKKIGTYIIPAKVNRLSDRSFENCSQLSELYIPADLMEIGSNQFQFCHDLKAFRVDSSNAVLGDFDGILYRKDTMCIIRCPPQKSGTITIPEGIRTIGPSAFWQCESLQEIRLPSTLTDIAASALNCRSSRLSIRSSSARYKVVDCLLYEDFPKRIVKASPIITGAYVLPDGVQVIDPVAFLSCTGLTQITFPSSLHDIGAYAFSECSQLVTVALPGALTNLGSGAFSRCSSLQIGTVAGSLPAIPYEAFFLCTNLISVSFAEGPVEIGPYAFNECTALKSFTVMRSVKAIGPSFKFCSALESLDVMGGITNVDSGAFSHCQNLKQIMTTEGPFYMTLDGLGAVEDSMLDFGANEALVRVVRATGGSKAGSQALTEMALILENDPYVRRDYARAVNLYRKAEQRGSAEAMYHLGRCYSQGVGVEVDKDYALTCFERAAKHGYVANGRLTDVEVRNAKMTLAQPADGRDQLYIQSCLRDAARQGDGVAMRLLSEMYFTGNRAPTNSAIALGWLYRAAEHGDALAQHQLGKILSVGVITPRNVLESAKWLSRAAASGISDSSIMNQVVSEQNKGGRLASDTPLASEKPQRPPEKMGARVQAPASTPDSNEVARPFSSTAKSDVRERSLEPSTESKIRTVAIISSAFFMLIGLFLAWEVSQTFFAKSAPLGGLARLGLAVIVFVVATLALEAVKHLFGAALSEFNIRIEYYDAGVVAGGFLIALSWIESQKGSRG